MAVAIQRSGFGIERLEQRRLLCADLTNAAAGHASGATDVSHAVDATAAPHGGSGAEGHVVAAFARSGGGMQGARVVWGEKTIIQGERVATWAIVSNRDDSVVAAGATIPAGLVENQPPHGGSGPAGAIASLAFPAEAQASTYFNHFALHTQPNGHPFSPVAVNPNRYRPAHFDFHFFSVPEEQVRAIPFAPPVAQVPADRLPAGYAQPGPSGPQMGRHAGPASELTQPGPFSSVMIAGFTPQADQMHFVEPMVTRELLLQQGTFTLPMPMPQTFDRDTRYPTSFQAVFQGGAHHFIFSEFVDTRAASAPQVRPASTTADDTRGMSALRLQPIAAANSFFSDAGAQEDDGLDRQNTRATGLAADVLS